MKKIDRAREIRLWMKEIRPYAMACIGGLVYYGTWVKLANKQKVAVNNTIRIQEQSNNDIYDILKPSQVILNQFYTDKNLSKGRFLKEAEEQNYKILRYSNETKWNEVKDRFSLMKQTIGLDGYYYASFNNTHYYIYVEN